MRKFEYYKPTSLTEAWELKDKISNSYFIAGGTDVMVKMKSGLLPADALISLRDVRELRGISVNGNVRIGAGTTISEVIENEELQSLVPALVEAAKRIGSLQIRNVATVGGNLGNCSPCADTAPILLAMEAKAVVQSAQGTRMIPLQDFFCGPGLSCLRKNEIMVELQIDLPAANAKAITFKKGRVQLDLALASVAVLMETENKICRKIRIAAGSVAPVPLRLIEAEKVLENKEVTNDRILEVKRIAMESVSPISDVRCSADYRRKIVGVYVQRGIETLMNGVKHEKRN
jgi:aerobic carbon-monoxide dehydrogenase medium subunit